jgi:uncharacterized membrane protein YidH (DUF202 family)
LSAVAGLRHSTPARDAGWPIEAVFAIIILAFFAEYVTVFFLTGGMSGLGGVAGPSAVAIVTACGVGLSGLAGEAIHRRRVDRKYRAKRMLTVIAAGIVVLAVAAAEWSRRLAIARLAAPEPNKAELDGVTMGAAALIVVLVPGIVLAHRERWSTMTTRRRVRHLQHVLRAHERRRDERYDEWVALRVRLRGRYHMLQSHSADDPAARPRPAKSA